MFARILETSGMITCGIHDVINMGNDGIIIRNYWIKSGQLMGKARAEIAIG